MILELFREFLIHLNTETFGFSNKFFKKMTSVYLFLLFCLCSLITVVQRMVIKQRKTVS